MLKKHKTFWNYALVVLVLRLQQRLLCPTRQFMLLTLAMMHWLSLPQMLRTMVLKNHYISSKVIYLMIFPKRLTDLIISNPPYVGQRRLTMTA